MLITREDEMNSGKNVFGFWVLLSLVIGNVVGSGIFLLPASLAAFGSISIFSWIMTSCGALFLALVLARLSQVYPTKGGPYAYCYKALGEFVGFQVAVNYWVAIWVANGGMIVALVGYLSYFFPVLAVNHGLAFIMSSTILWAITLINVAGVRAVGIAQLIFTALKFIPLLLVITVGCFFIHPHYLLSFNVSKISPIHALLMGMTLTFWSFLGLESATVPADYARDPRDIAKATLLGTLLASLFYIVGTAVVMGMIPMKSLSLSTAPFADVATILWGHWGGLLMAATALVSTMGALNGLILLQGQVPLAAAQDHLFPKFFAKLSKKNVPALGVILSSVLINLLLAASYKRSLVSQFTLIILLATFANLIPYFYSTIAEMKILFDQYTQGKAISKRKLIHQLVVATIAFVFMLLAVIGAGKDIVFWGALLTFGCSPFYVWIKFKWRAFTSKLPDGE